MKHFLLILFFNLLSVFLFSQNKEQDSIHLIDGKKYKIHIVQNEQSIYSIAKTYKLTIDDVVKANPGAELGIKSGQELLIPVPNENEPIVLTQIEDDILPQIEFSEHKVLKGETIYGISKRYNLKPGVLQVHNPQISTGLKEGQKLKIPIIITKTDEVVTDSIKEKPKKDIYNLALLLPFDFEKSSSTSVDQLVMNGQGFLNSSSIAIDFYEGVKKAIDTLKKAGNKVNLFLYEANEKDSARLMSLANDTIFLSSDLIIGPLFQTGFKVVSAIVKDLQIPIVSPYTNSNRILFNNPHTSKTTPANKTLMEEFAIYCFQEFSQTRLILVNSGKSKDQILVNSFKSKYNEMILAQAKNDTIIEVNGLSGTKDVYRNDNRIIYLVLSEDEVFLTDYVTQLKIFADKKKNIEVIGLKKWLEIDHLDPEYLNKVKFSFFTNQYINLNKKTVINLLNAYRAKYKTDPKDYYFSAFDISYYYLKLLYDEGPDFFMNLDKFPVSGLTMDFHFTRPSSKTGFENSSLRIVNYENYQLIEREKK